LRVNAFPPIRIDVDNFCHHFFFAVLAERLNAFAVGAPLLPGFLMRSPEPALILACFLRMRS
jgi:hypothetical protein